MGKSGYPKPAGGVYAAILTPRSCNSTEADLSAFLEYIDKVCRAKVHGIVLFGSTGEFVHYDLEDRMRAVGLAVKRSRVPALVNVSHSSLQGAVDLAQQAESAGAAGLLLMPPYFYRYQDGEIEQFYREFLNRADPGIPVYLYNLPCFTNPLSRELMAKLLATGRFTGIKDSSGRWETLEDVLKLKRTCPFQALTGNESHFLEALGAGADGIISGVAAALPELVLGAHDAFVTRNVEAQEKVSRHIADFMAWIPLFPASVAIKYVADVRGWLPAHLAVPLGPEACARVVDFRAWLSAWLPGVRT